MEDVMKKTFKVERNGKNPCPVCSPYPNAGYQQLSDDSEVPCFACNRREFEASVLKSSLIDGI
jgi:hypothetical protein